MLVRIYPSRVRSPPQSAVFSGAGISGDAPASLPRGFGLRDDLLGLMHASAKSSLPDFVGDDQLHDLLTSSRKLEVVLGRLSGAVGIDAADCLLALHLRLPNEAHLLAALHLVRGGCHVTLNFDIGIELAHELLTGGDAAAAALPDEYRTAAADWQALAAGHGGTLRVVASHAEFDKWVEQSKPPALLKIHGSLTSDQSHLVDVVVVDMDELGQLTPSRRDAVLHLGSASTLLITGYSGADPDVYGVLLDAAQSPEASWCCFSLLQGSPVPADLKARNIDLRMGDPEGLAVTALRNLLGLSTTPHWPEHSIGAAGYRERFDQWKRDFRSVHSPDQIAISWAWLLADGGDLDLAIGMLAELAGRPTADTGTLIRLADTLYTRARGNDRDRAESLYRQVIASDQVDDVTRLMCRLRCADIARGRAIRGDWRSVTINLCHAFSQPLLVLLATRAGRRGQEPAADAYRALQHTSLRVLEQAAVMGPRWSWPVLAWLCRMARSLGRPAVRLTSNGNRRGLVRQHGFLLAAYSYLLAGRRPPQALRSETQSLRDTYRSADDFPGSGNLAAALAVFAAAEGDLTGADSLLEEAHADYIAGRPDGQPIAAGQALVRTIGRLLDRLR